MLKKYNFTFLLAIIAILQGCSITEGLVKQTGRGVSTVIVASSAKTMADTQKINAKNDKVFIQGTQTLIAKQPLESQAKLINQSIEAKVEAAKNTRYLGMIEGFVVFFVFSFLIKIVVFLFDRYKPKIKSIVHE